MFTALNRFRRDTKASIAVIFALSTVPVLGLTGAAVDFGRAGTHRSAMQNAADNAALSAIIAPDARRSSLVEEVFRASYAPVFGVQVAVRESSPDSIVVVASTAVPTTILGAMGLARDIPLSARATAKRIFRGPPPCVLALNTRESETLRITGSSEFVAEDCVLHSNSTHETGMMLDANTAPRASAFCSVGGVVTSRTVTPTPRAGCSPMADPFAELTVPLANRCDYRNVSIDPNRTATLRPGSYCGGLALKGRVTLEPGVYVVEGLLEIASQAVVVGHDVTFALSGSQAGFALAGGSAVTIRAPRNGPYGGILVMQDRRSNVGFENRLAGGADSIIEGAIYTPTQRITLAGGAGFGQNSDYMPIIADRVRISGSNASRLDTDGIDMAYELPKSESGIRLAE